MSTAFHALTASFNAGEMTPLMDSRVDVDKYRSGCRVLENFIPRSYGGIYKRPATEFCGTTKNNSDANLLSFKRSTETNYMLEWGSGYLRFWFSNGANSIRLTASILNGDYSIWNFTNWSNAVTNYAIGDRVVNAGASWICTVAHDASTTPNEEPGVGSNFAQYWTKFFWEVGDLAYVNPNAYYCTTRYSPSSATFSATNWHQHTAANSIEFYYEIPSPYTVQETRELKFALLNDVMFLAHPNHNPYRLSRFSEFRWILEKVPFEFAPALDPNITTTAVQVQYDAVPWVTATNYAIGDRVTGSDGALYTAYAAHTSGATTAPITGANYLTVWNPGTSSQNIPAWTNATSYAKGAKVKVNFVIYEAKAAHTSNNGSPNPRLGNRPGSGEQWTTYWTISAADADLSGVQFKLVATNPTFSASDVGTSWQLSVGTTGRFTKVDLPSTGDLDPTTPLFIQGAYLFTTNWATGAAPSAGELFLEESLDGVTWIIVRSWPLTDVNAGNIAYSGDAPAVGGWYRYRATSLTGGGDKVLLEPVSSILTLPFLIESYTSPTEVKGKLIVTNDQLPPITFIGVSTTSYRKPAFSPEQGYPGAVAFHDNRLWWGGTTGNPSRLWGSKIDDFYIFLLGADADSSMDVTLAATEQNRIQWLSSFNRALVIGTTGDEWTLDSGETDGALTPASFRVRRRTRFGSNGLASVLTGESLLWVQKSGRKIREFTYEFASDSFQAPEMTLLSEHITRPSIVQCAFQSNLDPVLWSITKYTEATGNELLGFSYNRDQEVTAWHRHTTGERVVSGVSYRDTWKSVATMYGIDGSPEYEADEVWFVVSRFINGSYQNYIERFSPRITNPTWVDDVEDGLLTTNQFVGVDCAVRSPLSGGITALNLGRLQGRFPAAFTNNGTVTGGAITTTSSTFPVGTVFASSTPYVGIPYIARVQPMKLETQLQNGSTVARRWKNERTNIKVRASSEGQFADRSALIPGTVLNDIEYVNPEEIPIPDFPAHTGAFEQQVNGDYRDSIDFYIQHSGAGPFMLLSAVLKVQVEGS